VLEGFSVEQVRVAAEREVAHRIETHPLFRALAARHVPSDPVATRRRLLAQSLRLTDTMAPLAYQQAREAQRVLGVRGELELYQSGGRENAAIHLIESPVLVEIQGRLLPLLDPGTLSAVFGHELGHYLAHGPWSEAGAVHVVALAAGRMQNLPPDLESALHALSVLRELTADRVGLLASQDLDAALRLEMVATTGLSAESLTWDTAAYLVQCQELMQSVLADGGGIYASSHPEHSLRAYAIWLFSETREYHALTGRGSGHRALAEVDAQLWQLLGSSKVAADANYHMLDEPPRELQECALAACAIVAHADGNLADEEVTVIENTFAPLVGDWRDYLDLDFAHARFREAAPIIATGGSDLTHSLFNLLIHVMGADGTMAREEAAAILFVGSALGCEEQYARRLESALRSLRVSLALEQARSTPLPLPARNDEVADAFQAFLAGVLRRGETVTTLRRIVRLLGSAAPNGELLTRLRVLLAARGIVTETDLEQVGLDDRIHLSAPAAMVEPPSAPPAPELEPSRKNLIRALTRLREQLVSGDGRSPSVRVRTTRRGRIFDLYEIEKITSGRAERALLQIRNREVALLVDPEEAGQHPAAKRAASELLALDREQRARLEETGANDLFLGYPLVAGDVVSEHGGAYFVRGPLVLYPASLERQGKGAPGYRVSARADDPPIINQSLLRLIFNKTGLNYSDELADELDELVASADTEAVLAQLGKYGLAITARPSALCQLQEVSVDAIVRAPGLEIEECALLGIFPQSSSDLLQDYDGLLKALGDPRQDVGSIMGAADVLLPEALRRATPADARAGLEAEPTAPVVAADPVQRRVIEECRRNVAMVVDGPPGTGKSQVIVNLVADALRRGERVAVVCEKRAALDVVYQRLEALGLRHGVGIVHDVHEDRKSLYEQISTRIETFAPQPVDNDESAQRRREHHEVCQALDERSKTLASKDASSLTVGQLYSLVAGVELPHVAPDPALARVTKSDLECFLDAATHLYPLKDLWTVGSVFRDPKGQQPRKNLATCGADDLRQLEHVGQAAIQASRGYGQRLKACPVPVGVVALAQPALQRAQASHIDRQDEAGREYFGTLFRLSLTAPERIASLTEAKAAHDGAAEALARFERPVDFPESPELLHALQLLRRWAGQWMRIFVWSWWRARAQVRTALITAWPDRSAEPFHPPFVKEVYDRFQASKAWRVIYACLGSLGLRGHAPATASGLSVLLTRLAALGQAASEIVQSRATLISAGAWPSDVDAAGALAAWDASVDERLSLLEARERLAATGRAVRAVFPWVDELPAAAQLETLSAALERDGERLVEADRHLNEAQSACSIAAALLDAVVSLAGDHGADRWRALLTTAWAEARLQHLESQNRRLLTLGTAPDDREEARQAGKLAELELTLSELEVERILSRMDRAELLHIPPADKGKRRTPKQKVREELLKEVKKKTRVLPLRTFVRRFAAEGLLDLVPVWLLSPETIAILFPRQPLFDLVVFDEASQCTVEAGLPVLARTRRVVVAGDEKQMPPSSYFALSSSDDDDAEEPQDQDGREMRDMLGAESLLNLARSRVPHSGLAWHYRCRDESLIAFSNHALYHGELLTIPATSTPAAPSVIHWVPVANGTYDAGANPPEAEAVVDLLHQLLAREARPSIGVVTFNLKQRRTILDAIDARCVSNPAFGRVWRDSNTGESIDQRPFVKNLENVQGDERDVIIFSLGHAPQERRRAGIATGEVYVPARFGPLGQRGGERRLNVAISRAKAECWVVASFLPSQLSVAKSRHVGPGLFKQFLEFVHHMSGGRHKPAEQVLDLVREVRLSAAHRDRPAPMEAYTPLVVQIHDALEKEGVPLQLHVGSSQFRVPLAVLDPNDPTRFVLAIIPEEGSPDEPPLTPFDRYVHRPSVLRDRAWQTLRVTSATWRKRREEVIRQILELVPGARGALQNEVWTKHREALRAPPPPGKAEYRPAVPHGNAETPRQVEPTADEQPSTTIADETPEWARNIENPRFRKALLHIYTHGSLNETELVNIVGGPRHARSFARELDDWLEILPFRVEVQHAGGTKLYRNLGAR